MSRILILLGMTLSLGGCVQDTAEESEEKSEQQSTPMNTVNVQNVKNSIKKFSVNKTQLTSTESTLTKGVKVYDVSIDQYAIVKGTITLVLNDGADWEGIESESSLQGLGKEELADGVYRISYPDGRDLASEVKKLSSMPAVKQVELDIEYLSPTKADR